MAKLQGLTDLYGRPTTPPVLGETGRDPENWGTPPDRRHAIPGDSSHQLPYDARVYGAAIEADDQVESTPLPGLTYDQTPNVHSAPYPAWTQDPLIAAEQLRDLHGRDLGAVELTVGVGTPYPETVDSGRYDSPNQNELAKVPGQLKAGSDDTEQGYGSENGFGFQFGRQFRRWFKDPIPLDRTGTVHGERPFYGRHPVETHTYDVDSEFGAAGDTRTGMNLGPTPTGYPTPYEQPPNPTYRGTVQPPEESGYSGGWVAG